MLAKIIKWEIEKIVFENHRWTSRSAELVLPLMLNKASLPVVTAVLDATILPLQWDFRCIISLLPLKKKKRKKKSVPSLQWAVLQRQPVIFCHVIIWFSLLAIAKQATGCK